MQFDLESDVMEATYGQRQKYITTVHGIFNKNAIINGNDYEQELVNYDLQKGRANNGGKFKLKMKVSHQLDNSLVITIGAVADRFYFQKPANLTKKDNDFDFKYKLKNLKLITYSNVKNNLPQSNPIAPQNSFGHQRKFVANSVVFTSDIDINSPNGKLHSRTVSQPYLITMEPKTSSFQEIDLQYLYQKGNPESSKVFLTFHFQPVFQVGTFGIYTNDRDPQIYNFLI